MSYTSRPKTIKYLSNKELLAEIARCKKAFSTFTAPEYSDYDAIVESQASVTPVYLLELLEKLNSKLEGGAAPKTANGLIFRVMTYDHIPLDPDRKRKSRATNQSHARTNFPPFKHYLFNIAKDGSYVWKEVGRSHWKGDFETGEFTIEKGRMSERLGLMFMMLVDKYSAKSNFRSYSYRDEMKGLALTHLCQVGLQFDESKSSNPFAFFTTTLTHCLSGDTEILTLEYGSVPIRDVAGQEVTLLDGNGDWTKCNIYSHGVQETQLNYFMQGGRKEEIWSTLDHGWISNGEVIKTRDFRSVTFVDDLRPSKEIKNNSEYKKGVIHGIIYGDGTMRENKNSINAYMRLCGEKDELSYWLNDYEYTTPPSSNGNKIFHLKNVWTNLKKLPTGREHCDYLLGFIRGWIATDGCVSSDHKGYPTLCGDEAEYDWLKKWGPIVGIHCGGFTKLNEVTNYGIRSKISLNFHLRTSSLISEDFIRTRHRENWDARNTRSAGKTGGNKYDWALIESMKSEGISSKEIAEKLGHSQTAMASAYCVFKKAREKSISGKRDWRILGEAQPNITRMEEVYCPVVSTTNSFALSSGVHSSNCFVRIINLEKKNQSIRDDLLINMGMSPSNTRQIENELAQSGIVEPKALPAKRGRKSAVQLAAEKKADDAEKDSKK